jgi:UDP-N-acetylmuramyl tripeptide synthase
MNYGNKIKLIKAVSIKKEGKKISFIIHNSLFIIPLLGEYNLYNVLAAMAVAQALGIDLAQIKRAVAQLKPLPGRLEFIENNLGLTIIVDYAFEPKALEKLYEIIKDIPHQKIIHILGSCGGGRDKARRPILGRKAAENADIVIVTNEDPYDEEPGEIIEQVANGAKEIINNQSPRNNNQTMTNDQLPITKQIQSPTKSWWGIKFKIQNLFKIIDRREAITKALELAKKGDLVLITGKGAEQAICLKNGQRIPWDDRQVVREELRKLIS